MTEDERQELLRIARTAIEARLFNKRLPEFKPTSLKLQEKCGVFVTLKKKGSLRGCIGYVEGIRPLYQAVSEMAINSAFSDPRFPSLETEEWKDIKIEITVMSPLEKITDPRKIEIGKHGILIRRGFCQGLLLPQVATEEGWDRETFLEHTCFKAGLPADAWKDKATEIYIFSGEVFGE